MSKTFNQFSQELNETLLQEEELAELRASTITSYVKKNWKQKNAGPKWKRRARGLSRAASRIRNVKGKEVSTYFAPVTKEAAEPIISDLIDTIVETLDADISEEQLDELKRSTLASYVQRSSVDARNRAYSSGKGDTPKYTRKEFKRALGINRAASKLAKEEIEVLDSIADLVAEEFNLTEAADLDILTKHVYGPYVTPDHIEERYQLEDLTAFVVSEMVEGNELDLVELSHRTLQSYIKKSAADEKKRWPNRNNDPNIENRYNGRMNAQDRLKGKFTKKLSGNTTVLSPGYKAEEVEAVIDAMGFNISEEQLVELKKSTLASYTKKSLQQHDDSKEANKNLSKSVITGDWKSRLMAGNDKRAAKRSRGLDRAGKKLGIPADTMKALKAEEVEAVIDAMDLDLSEEQLQELKASTIASYQDKAEASKTAASKSQGAAINSILSKRKKGKDTEKEYSDLKGLNKTVGKRLRGLDRAAKATTS
jgi:hypothetical protein